jgi:hypothetical protein
LFSEIDDIIIKLVFFVCYMFSFLLSIEFDVWKSSLCQFRFKNKDLNPSVFPWVEEKRTSIDEDNFEELIYTWDFSENFHFKSLIQKRDYNGAI